jgi:DNA-binding HxlR family transcriptional regulator
MILRDNANCSVAKTLNMIGDKWTLLVLREAFYGTRRFDDFHQQIGCARSMLSNRLGKLIQNGILYQTEYHDEGKRRRLEYGLTEKGSELLNILIALKQWGDRWTHGKNGSPYNLYHRGCRAKVNSKICCDNGHIIYSPKEMVLLGGKIASKA